MTSLNVLNVGINLYILVLLYTPRTVVRYCGMHINSSWICAETSTNDKQNNDGHSRLIVNSLLLQKGIYCNKVPFDI